ncbi:hypothetical protein [Kitasatospora aureofaciens]|uniref:hypothetical protein n=1 Tax=Kitasatospora aureofaciens TaxID=1894 RepID=UPI00123D0BF2
MGVTGRRSEISSAAGWEIREENGHWRVRTVESYRRRPATLLTARHVRENQYAFLSALPEQGPTLSASTDNVVTRAVDRLRDQDTLASEVAQRTRHMVADVITAEGVPTGYRGADSIKEH